MVRKTQFKRLFKYHSRPFNRQWNWLWQKYGVFNEPKLKWPKYLSTKTSYIDPLMSDEWKESMNFGPKLLSPEQLIDGKRIHPDYFKFSKEAKLMKIDNWNKEKRFIIKDDVDLKNGLAQAALITRTVPIEKKVEFEEFKQFLTKSDHERVKKEIRQSIAFDANQTKQPRKLVTPKYRGDILRRLKSEYTTSEKRQCLTLHDSLWTLATVIQRRRTNDYNLSLNNFQFILENLIFDLNFQRGDKKMNINYEIAREVRSHTMRINGIPSSDVDELTSNYQYENMWPIFPTNDFKKSHIYHMDNISPTSPKHLQTFVLVDPAVRNRDHPPSSALAMATISEIEKCDETERRMSRLMLQCFAKAKQEQENLKLATDSNGRLIEPLIIRCINLFENRYDFCTFQLNTINMTDDLLDEKWRDVKNLFFYDSNNEIYFNRLTMDEEPYGTRKNLQRQVINHLDYNEEVIGKYLSFVHVY
ncbi:hypothetical protein SNEBB_011181 [Seison nebaliae]|nr:hypothetical protein SNEBB_011181 [Seison nebaliae]